MVLHNFGISLAYIYLQHNSRLLTTLGVIDGSVTLKFLKIKNSSLSSDTSLNSEANITLDYFVSLSL